MNVFVSKILVHARVAVVFETSEVVESHIPTSSVIGVVSSKDVEQRARGGSENIAGAGGENLHSCAVRSEANDASTTMLKTTSIRAHRLHKSKVSSRNVDPAIDTELKSVCGVIRWAHVKIERDSLDEHFGILGDAISIAIEVNTDVGGVEKVEPVVIPDESARGIDLLDELGDLISTTVIVGITKPKDSAALWVSA